MLADRNVASAREVFGVHREHEAAQPSRIGYATLRRIEAQLWLAEGRFGEALAAISKSWKALEDHADLSSTERAASTVAIAGIIHALQGALGPARHCFVQARDLPVDLHNHIAHGWASVGDAILKAEAGDRQGAIEAILWGLESVRRCGAPARHLLLKLFREFEGSDVLDAKKWLSELQLLATGANVLMSY